VLAEEQRRLIEVLTHEVRQPLNNASAALQSIGDELTDAKRPDQNIAIMRAQAVIDKVGMALSNALVAATILERRQKFNPVRYDPSLLIDMVVMDFNEKERTRIQVDTGNSPLYVTADPVLLRIALRNLVDNALRYFPKGSQMTLQLVENETDMGADFRVINQEPVTLNLSENVFGRRIRGRSADIEGSGMGRYITSEIAKLHQGSVRTSWSEGQRVFSLFIAD
jgi:signal transduction histidine kinase